MKLDPNTSFMRFLILKKGYNNVYNQCLKFRGSLEVRRPRTCMTFERFALKHPCVPLCVSSKFYMLVLDEIYVIGH